MTDDRLNEPDVPAEPKPHWFQRKCPNWALSLVLLLILTVFGGPFVIVAVTGWHERNQSYELLANANDRGELEQVVGRIGVLLDLPDGQWIAIRYRDSHGYQGYSIAVALTSDGRWLESTYHYCGQFSAYKHLLDRMAEATTEDERQVFETAIADDEHLRRLHRVQTQCSLDDAIDELLAMQFTLSSETRPARMVQMQP